MRQAPLSIVNILLLDADLAVVITCTWQNGTVMQPRVYYGQQYFDRPLCCFQAVIVPNWKVLFTDFTIIGRSHGQKFVSTALNSHQNGAVYVGSDWSQDCKRSSAINSLEPFRTGSRKKYKTELENNAVRCFRIQRANCSTVRCRLLKYVIAISNRFFLVSSALNETF